jgi:hypothetical protein
MSAVEQEIIEKVRRLDEEAQKRVLTFIEELEISDETPPHKFYTAPELLQLPEEERNRLVAEAFERAADEDFEIFEAYSEENFDDE